MITVRSNVLAHPTLAPIEKFEVTDKMVADFEAFLKRKKFTFTNSTQLLLDSLVKKSKADGYYKANQSLLTHSQRVWKTTLRQTLRSIPHPVRQRLAYELLSRYYGQAEIIRYQLRDDKQYDPALALLAIRRNTEDIELEVDTSILRDSVSDTP